MKKVLSLSFFLTVFFFSLIFTNCSSFPDDTNAKEWLENRINKDSKGRIQLLEFKKTNGLTQNDFGQEIYKLEFEALIEIKEGGYKERGMDGVKFNNFKIYEKIGPLFGPSSYLEKGWKVELVGHMEYEKTENGWRVSEDKNFSAIKIDNFKIIKQ